jgi:thiazole synthase
MKSELFEIAGETFTSRLILGTGGLSSLEILDSILKVTSSEIATVAIRRVDPNQKLSIFNILSDNKIKILPNTAGCYSATDAVKLALLARESLDTNWIKLEVIGDDKTLLPDTVELLKAAETLINMDFKVLAYTSTDLIIAKRLMSLGVSAIMPLASPIGSGMGLEHINGLIRIVEEVETVPVIVDAGIGTASDAALAMEIGASAVLVASAITKAVDSIVMAEAIAKATEAGRLAYRAGRIPKQLYAVPSSSSSDMPNL